MEMLRVQPKASVTAGRAVAADAVTVTGHTGSIPPPTIIAIIIAIMIIIIE